MIRNLFFIFCSCYFVVRVMRGLLIARRQLKDTNSRCVRTSVRSISPIKFLKWGVGTLARMCLFCEVIQAVPPQITNNKRNLPFDVSPNFFHANKMKKGNSIVCSTHAFRILSLANQDYLDAHPWVPIGYAENWHNRRHVWKEGRSSNDCSHRRKKRIPIPSPLQLFLIGILCQ